jgi:hypothetical protein
MRSLNHATLLALAMPLVIAGCQRNELSGATTPPPTSQPESAAADSEGAVLSEQSPAAVWPASLTVVGVGFPNPGDACRQLGESDATRNFLDDSATLAGCLSANDAAALAGLLGGKIVGTVEGVTLVSVPAGASIPGDGDGQGDGMVPGTPYHATAIIRCSGYRGAAAGSCDAGVIRNRETGAVVDVKLPDGVVRKISFKPDGSFLTFDASQADGTAGLAQKSRREAGITIAMLGSERYEIPDVLLTGD